MNIALLDSGVAGCIALGAGGIVQESESAKAPVGPPPPVVPPGPAIDPPPFPGPPIEEPPDVPPGTPPPRNPVPGYEERHARRPVSRRLV